MNKLFRRLAPAVAFGIPLAAFAQPAAGDPVQPGSPAPLLQYRSAFADYKPYKDVPRASWRAVNDAVAGSGGMGQMPMADAPPKPASTQPAHEHHPMHGGKK